jgi:hypothetical protein
MPIEYWPLFAPGAKVGAEAPYIVRHEHASLAGYPPARLPYALFYFDIRYLISAIGEMLLDRRGYERRTSVRTMTLQGDERDVTPEKAAAYRDFVKSLPKRRIDAALYDDPETIAALQSIITGAVAKGVIVVGGLPTIIDDTDVAPGVIEKLRAIYERNGGCFLQLPNSSMYPRDAFFDTVYHLQEPYQIAHSAALAPYLAAISHRTSCRRIRSADEVWKSQRGFPVG